jgi:1-deoxy-D-xylulose-5-phosphate reductoisomerase
LSLVRSVSILGSTGSVGVSTLDLLESLGRPVRVRALTGGRNVARLADQALAWRPEVAVIADASLAGELATRLQGSGVAVEAGAAAVAAAAGLPADWVMSAIVGFAGLAPTLAAISAGSVFMGANTYIGNAPNLMVKAIAEERGVQMPGFFGYMAWSGAVLIPLFVVMTLIWFR